MWNHAGFPETVGLLGGGSPAVKGNTVIVAYSSGEVFALAADSGTPLWTDTLIAASQLEGVSSLPHIRARPIIVDKITYLVSHGGRIAAINMLTGARIWYKDFGGMRTPAVGGNYLFLITNQEQLACVNRSNGNISWAVNLPQDVTRHINWAGPVLTSEGLVVYGSNGVVLFISPTNGQVLKKLKSKTPLFMSPVIANQYLLAFTDQAEVIAWRSRN
jgi:outer membrane protein assembly factor BamB